MTIFEKLKYRYIYYANIVLFYLLITQFFKYALDLKVMIFYLASFIILTEGIIYSHKNDITTLFYTSKIPLLFYPLIILAVLSVTSNIFNMKIYSMNFDINENILDITEGRVIKEYEDNNYVKIIDSQGNRQHFVFDYPKTALEKRLIKIPKDSSVSIKFIQTNSRLPSNKGYFLLAYDIRSKTKIYLDGKLSPKYYSEIRLLALRNIFFSILFYSSIALINYIFYFNFLNKGQTHGNS